MPKYHISATGTPAVCNATIQCPLTEADGSPSPHGEFANERDAVAWAEKALEARYGTFWSAHAKTPELTPREIRERIAAAEKSKGVWQGGDSELAAERTRANRAEQDAKIEKLRAMLPEGEPATQLELHRKVLWGEGGEASVDEMVEWLDSYKGGYISDQEYAWRRDVHKRIAQAYGFKASAPEFKGGRKVTELGHGWRMEEEDPDRTWGGYMTIRNAAGKEIDRREGASRYRTSDEALQMVGQHLRLHPEDTPKS